MQSGKGISPKLMFEPGRLIQGRKYVFLSNTTFKQRVINAIANKLKKSGYNVFHSYDDAVIGFIS